MPEKFRGRFRIPTSRARWWDYGNGSYFITICTKNRIHFFGEIIEHNFYPSKIGEIAESIWRKIPEQFQYVELGGQNHTIKACHDINNTIKNEQTR